MARPYLVHDPFTGSDSENYVFAEGTEAIASLSPSTVSAVPSPRRQMFDHDRLNGLDATQKICRSLVTPTMRSDPVVFARFAPIRRAGQIQSQENEILMVGPAPRTILVV
jgi:hypothetical protein